MALNTTSTSCEKFALEVVVNDDFVDRTIEIIERVARTGVKRATSATARSFNLPVEEVIRIGETVRGKEAV